MVGGLVASSFTIGFGNIIRQPEAWKWQRPEECKNQGQGSAARDNKAQTMWVFEPHVAEQIFDAWVAEAKIPVVREAWLDREHGVEKSGSHIKSINTLDGNIYRGSVFIDATYEGDLMAAAGVSYRVGRESQQEYDEKWNGVQTGVLHHQHFFAKPVDPYLIPGDPKSGLLPSHQFGGLPASTASPTTKCRPIAFACA